MAAIGSIARPRSVTDGQGADDGEGDGGRPGGETRRPRRRRRLLVAAGVLVPVAVAGAVIATRDGGSGDPAPDAGSTATAPVEVRTLSQTERVDGTLDFGEPRGVAAGSAGTVTAVAAAGSTVDRGDTLFAIDRHPTVLLVGDVPMYRDLSEGVDDGPDVAQLEENIAALGHTDDGSMAVDEHFDASTADAVAAWQEARGVEATGAVTRADAVFLPAAARVADTAVDPGALVEPGTTVLEHTGSARVVRAEIEPGQADIVHVDDSVSVTLPDGTEVAGTVATVAEGTSSSQEAAGSGGSGASGGGTDAPPEEDAAVEVTVALDDQAAAEAYTTASVEVELTGRRREDVVAVPVTSLVALAGGGYALEVAHDGGPTELVPVDPGMYADGYVEVTGDGIEEGIDVVVAEP